MPTQNRECGSPQHTILSANLPPPQDDAICHDFANKSIIASGTTAIFIHIHTLLVTCTHFLLHTSFSLSTIQLTGAILACMHALTLVQSCDVRSSCDCRDFPATQGSIGDSPFHLIAHTSLAGARALRPAHPDKRTRGILLRSLGS